jgi:hypothetical protein
MADKQRTGPSSKKRYNTTQDNWYKGLRNAWTGEDVGYRGSTEDGSLEQVEINLKESDPKGHKMLRELIKKIYLNYVDSGEKQDLGYETA